MRIRAMTFFLGAAFAAVLLGGCATTGTTEEGAPALDAALGAPEEEEVRELDPEEALALDLPTAAPSAETPALDEVSPTVTFAQHYGTLGELVRRVGERVGGGLVLMHGLEALPAPEINLENAAYATLAGHLAASAQAKVEQTPHYHFIHADHAVYAPLLQTDLQARLPASYQEIGVSAAFGGGTPLYNVLGILSQNLGMTLVADNILAEAVCGELTLPETPLPKLLDAVFKSALLPPAAYEVEATDEYVFFRSARRGQTTALLNGTALDAEAQALLERRVSLVLPTGRGGGRGVAYEEGATPLRDVLGPLSREIGVPVTASPRIMALPVNFTVLTDVPVSVALELLIRQWPLERFGYEVTGEGIRIRQR